MKARINATVGFVPHPDPQRMTDIWVQLIVKEILKREVEASTE